ncbi:MAG: Unknown protein [uncultured Aureispira sp.]|uniref:Uncharacterized protein n=1 Tax=uncultured Aureispira sp. TaxID=1331704 RepID=A0A6S6UDE2_9BACT|nr:MAG: Unknown protein [uncultured Aureispira sp.]
MFDLVLFKDVTITTKDNTIWTMPKGEVAKYYKKTNNEGKIIEEKWETISYD